MTRLIIILTLIAATVGTVSAQAKPKPSPSPIADTKLNVIKEGSGIGGIKVGESTSADVIRRFGKVYRWEINKKYSYQMTYDALGLSFYMCQADKKETIFLIEIKAPFKGRTTKGVVIGKTTKEETEKLYGPPSDGFEYKGIHFYYNRYGKRNVITEIDIVENAGLRQCGEKK